MAKDDSTTTTNSSPHESAPKSAASSERAADHLLEARFLLEEQDAKSADAIAYVHAVMSQIGLPRSPQQGRVWTRSNGNASLTLIAGGITSKAGVRVEQPLPQGPYARLMLADISTYAVRYSTPYVPMEDSVKGYMRKRLKLFGGGGARGPYTSFKREALALSSAHVELSMRLKGEYRQVKAPPVEEFTAWQMDDDDGTLWPGELVLTQRFYESLKAHAAPIDMRAYRALAHSALAQDIYTWLSYRLPRLKQPLGLPWSVLAEQFGGYTDVKRFREEFIKRLKEVQTVYPDAKIEVIRGRRGQAGGSLLMKPSTGPVPRVGAVLPAMMGAPAVLGEPIPAVRAPEPERPAETTRDDPELNELIGPADASRDEIKARRAELAKRLAAVRQSGDTARIALLERALATLYRRLRRPRPKAQ